MTWDIASLKRALRTSGSSAGLIKGDVATEPGDGLFPGFSASGQDVWLERPQFSSPGLVLSAVGARCGKVFESQYERWGTVANTAVLLPRPGYDLHFLWYLVNREDFWERGGTAQPYVRVEDTLQRRLPLPPLEQQRAIADYLDRETARIDALIEKKRCLTERLSERRQALITSAVQCDIGPGASSRCGGVGWRRLKHYCDVLPEYGLNVSSDAYVDEGFRLLRTTDIDDSGALSPESEGVFVGQYLIDPRHVLKPGDLLFSRAGSLGRCFRVPHEARDFTFAGYLVRFRPMPICESRYIQYCASAAFAQASIIADAVTSTISNFNAERYGNLLLPDTDPERQRAIADYLDRETARIDLLIEKINQQINLLLEHRQALITAAVTGELPIPGMAP